MWSLRIENGILADTSSTDRHDLLFMACDEEIDEDMLWVFGRRGDV